MNFKQITGIYFSPTESTKKVVELITAEIHGNRASLDLTDAVSKRPDYNFTENEAVIVGVPVYGGRVPETAVERLLKLHGRQTPAVLIVTYGNRRMRTPWWSCGMCFGGRDLKLLLPRRSLRSTISYIALHPEDRTRLTGMP